MAGPAQTLLQLMPTRTCRHLFPTNSNICLHRRITLPACNVSADSVQVTAVFCKLCLSHTACGTLPRQ